MRNRWCLAVTCGLLLAAAPRVAQATDARAEREARKRFEEGYRRMSAGDFEGARRAFTESLVLMPRGSTLNDLAVVEMKLGLPLDALAHERQALTAPDMTGARRKEAQLEFDQIYAQTGHLAVTTREGASVKVDGQAEGSAPLPEPVDVMPGRHRIEADLGALHAQQVVDTKAGVVTHVDVEMEPAPSPAAAPAPPVATEPPPPAAPPPVDLPPPAEPTRFWTTRREVGAIIGGVGVIALGIATVEAISAKGQNDQFGKLSAGVAPGQCHQASPPSVCADLQSANDAQSTDVKIGRVFLVGGAAEAVVGAALVFWPQRSSRSTTEATLTPLVSPSMGGMQLRGEF